VAEEEHRPNPDLAERLDLDFDTPHSARVHNYWLGGKDNFEADRAAGDAVLEVYPGIAQAVRQSRQFLIRVVRHLTGEAGVRQFIDIGTGLPTMQNTHEVAQSVAPDCRIVYVDNDPMVLSHARALLTNTTPEGVTTYVHADVHDPDRIVSDARNVLNFNEPIAVMFFGILGHVADFDEARSIVGRVMAATPPGSFLALEDSTNTSAEVREGAENYARAGAIPYNLRSPEQLAELFTGLDMVDPGLVPVSQWRPNPAEVGTVTFIDKYGAVARKG
jgi:ubiquinone/menaquinone biosynthesis C-methylase UbiE